MISVSYLAGYLDIGFMLLFISVSMLFGSMISVGTLILEELTFGLYPGWKSLSRLIAYAFLETSVIVSYSQLALTGLERDKGDHRWGEMVRKASYPHDLYLTVTPNTCCDFTVVDQCRTGRSNTASANFHL